MNHHRISGIPTRPALQLALVAALSLMAQAHAGKVYYGGQGQNTDVTINTAFSASSSADLTSVFGGLMADTKETKTVGDVSITLKKASANVDDVFGGGYATGANSKSTVGDVSIVIDVGEGLVTGNAEEGGGDVIAGGYAYHYTAADDSSHPNKGVTAVAGDTRIEFKSGVLNGLLIGGGSVNGYASAVSGVQKRGECLTQSISGSTHIVVSGGTVNEAVVGGGKVRISSEAGDRLQGIATVENARIDITGGTVHGVVGGGWSEAGFNLDAKASSPRSAESIVKGETVINISGGTVERLYQSKLSAGLQIHNAAFDGAVAGGGVAAYGGTDTTNDRYSKTTSGAVTINITGGTINGAVYAGGVSSASNRDAYNSGEGGIVEVGSSTVLIMGGTINGSIYAGGASVSYEGTNSAFAAGSTSVKQGTIILGKGAVVTGDVYAGGAVFNTSGLSNKADVLLEQNTLEAASIILDSADIEIGGKIHNRTVLHDGTTVAKKENGTAAEVTATGNFNDGYGSSQAAAAAFASFLGEGVTEAKLEKGESNNEVLLTLDGKGNVTAQEVVLNAKTVQFAQTAAQNFMAWRLAMNDMNKRLGELRDSEGSAGVWARVDAGRQKYAGAKNDFTTLQFGADARLPASGNLHAGLALSYTSSDFSYRTGDGDSSVLGLAGYASWLGETGSFMDVIAKIARIDSDSKVYGTKADYDTTAYSVSAETGHRFELSRGVFVEPQIELSYGHVEGVSFNTVRDDGASTRATLDGTDSLVGRLGLRAGIACPEKKGGVYLKASVLREFLGDMELRRGEGTLKSSLEDTWFSYGVGGNYNFTPYTQLYADVERTSGADLSEPWRVNVGLRWSF